MLGKKFGYQSYLEICTSTTGGTYAQVDKVQFSRHVRAMYRRPDDFSDEETIDLSVESENGEELFEKLMRSGEKFDIVFIDSFHTYSASLRDLVYGLQLVHENGMILIHDCFPPNEACTAPAFIPGEWCGLSFAAYLDVVLFTPGLHYITIDSDYGCGLITKSDLLSRFPTSSITLEPDLVLQWRALGLSQKYGFFKKHYRELLHLVSPDEFLSGLFQGGQKTKTGAKGISAEQTAINELILSKVIRDDLQNKLAETKKYLTETQELLSDAQNDLLKKQDELHAIQNTFTWKMHNLLTHNRPAAWLFKKVILPLKQ